MGQDRHPRRRVAVIGSGVSGLTAAHLLRDRAEVTLLEADDRLGGHAHTHRVTGEDGGELLVDSGFIVHNRRTYPHLVRLFDELGVDTRPAEMSLSVSCEGCGLEYAGARGGPGPCCPPAPAPPPPTCACSPRSRASTGPPARSWPPPARTPGPPWGSSPPTAD
ncbi:FAD-dependent oxidoreductase [Nocardiopsis protaetiae]|uniref:FAD-dependent oxidoreductase n=1 Tax=Nocardiopsis protaetiae TaxID=3382270 RepID=UPI00387AF3BF